MLSERMRGLRLARDISQVGLANRLNVTKQSVSNWENENILPSIEMLVKIADFFAVSTDYLLGLDERRYIDVTGLPQKTVAHIEQIIADLRGGINNDISNKLEK